jgi:hypothetical protein
MSFIENPEACSVARVIQALEPFKKKMGRQK